VPGSVAAKIHAHAEDAAAQPQPKDIKREANERKNAAIKARIDAHKTAAVEGAGVAESEGPKAGEKSPAGATRAPTTSGKSSDKTPASDASQATDAASPSSEPDTQTSETAAEKAERERRYDVKSIRDWARKHPEEAAEVAKQVFHVDGDLSSEWIRVQNKFRKRQTALEEREREITARIDAHEKESKETLDALDPIANLFQAVNPDRGQDGAKFDPKKIDFDAADQAFQDLTGVAIDEYMRHRARKGVAISPEARALKLENEQLKKKLEKAAPEEAKDDKPKAKAEPETASNKWESDIPEEHALRQFAGWQKELSKAMAPYHDPVMDEYSKDPEVVADALLLRKVKEFELEEPEVEVKPKPKPVAARAPAPAPKPKAPALDELIPSDAYAYRKPAPKNGHETEPAVPGDFASRKRKAMERHTARMRGELVDD
jgi:hypothetical protein